jgi:hypothetical protein
MAITKKHIAIQERKAAYRREAEDLLVQAKAACQKVPAVVLHGSANLAASWRDKAEDVYSMREALPYNLTTAQMLDRLDGIRQKLEFLRNPVRA